MNSSNFSSHISHSSSELLLGEVIFDRQHLEQLARNTGFYLRKPRKVEICSLLGALCLLSVRGTPSCNDLAAKLPPVHLHGSGDAPQEPSRQALHLRMGAPLEKLLSQLIAEIICGPLIEANADTPAFTSALESGNYTRIIVEDSTIIKLPQQLFEEFSGVSNGHTQVCNARIQVTYELLTRKLVSFSIDPYSKNDLKAAPELQIEPGDLVLRDRGYLTADEIQRHWKAHADCIYRHKTGIVYLDAETHEPIDLARLLRENGGTLDVNVLLNNEAQTPVRLVAAPVNEETANLRRMRARKENHGHNPSKAVLELMSYTIFVTTIPVDRADFGKLLGLYGLRWRIEIIFKAWKSHLKFGVLHRVSRLQMLIILKVRLLVIACSMNLLHGPLERALREKYNAHLSLLKLIRFLSASNQNILRALAAVSGYATEAERRPFYRTLLRYCCYDRRKRRNYCQIFEEYA